MYKKACVVKVTLERREEISGTSEADSTTTMMMKKPT
jgi:hypothetical protein